MLTRNAVRELLGPFGIPLSDQMLDGLILYLDLLLRWNRKINLTAIADPGECVTRHFGESFLLSHVTQLRGRLLDIGSGAGFPGLAVKLIAPDLEIVLLEPVAKKRAFLKEVSRACCMSSVYVVGSSLEEFVWREQSPPFDIITVRAVGNLEMLIPAAAALLKPNGHLCLWVGRQQAREIPDAHPNIRWLDPVTIPLSHDRLILTGMQRGAERSYVVS